MRLLILSEVIQRKQRSEKPAYTPPYDVHLDVGDLNEVDNFSFSVFDYDVSIVHITEPRHHTMGYYQNMPKLLQDSRIALEHGRSIICLPESRDFLSRGSRNVGGMSAYRWLRDLEVELQDNIGEDIKPSGTGRALVVQDYLKYAPKYYQIVTRPEPTPERRLAVVDDTEIIVGLEHQIGRGTLVVLPPPTLDRYNYLLMMSDLVRLARRYYERSQRQIIVGDAPGWLERFLVPSAKTLDAQMKELADEKAKYDRIAYVLYGTGDQLESSILLLLEQLGLDVESQPPGANIDLKATHPELGIGFAIEVTGTRGAIRKRSRKIPQALQHVHDCIGTPEQNDRLVLVANTQYHLDPSERNRESFSPNVVKLLRDNGVLLITTVELYEQWREVHEGNRSVKDLVQELYDRFGLYKSLSS